MQTPEERAFRGDLVHGYGVASPLHKVRLYDESNKEEDIRVTFYRDSASWCVSSVTGGKGSMSPLLCLLCGIIWVWRRTGLRLALHCQVLLVFLTTFRFG